MRRLPILLCGLCLTPSISAATLEEAARLFAARNWEQAIAAYQGIVDEDPGNALALFRLARARAATGDTSRALTSLQAWVAAGAGSYQAAMAVPEFELLRPDPRFVALIEPLKPCTAPEYRQFDFWLGDWNVESQASPGVVSRNRITSIHGGCTLLEQYVTPGGYEGSSFNFYDSASGVWRQAWIDNQGVSLFLEGRFDGKSMVMRTTADPKQINRITWTPLEDGRVRQHWESTTDGGETWSTVFDGYYSRRGAAG